MVDETINNDLNATLRGLVMQTRRGDQAAYKTLLAEIAPIIRRMVLARMGRVGSRADAEDITQDTLLAVHLKLHTYDAALPFLAWLNAVAKHKMIDTLRRRKGITLSIDDDNAPELPDETNFESGSINRDLQKLLDQLKPPAGEIIYALKVEGASVKDIASTHRLSESNVKVIVHRGLQKLAELVRAA